MRSRHILGLTRSGSATRSVTLLLLPFPASPGVLHGPRPTSSSEWPVVIVDLLAGNGGNVVVHVPGVIDGSYLG